MPSIHHLFLSLSEQRWGLSYNRKLYCFVQSKNYELRITVVRFTLQAFEKKTEVEKIRGRNRKLVDNILPEHVADYFLQHQSKDETVISLNLQYCSGVWDLNPQKKSLTTDKDLKLRLTIRMKIRFTRLATKTRETRDAPSYDWV